MNLEIMTKINTKTQDLTGTGKGGLPDITSQEILLGLVGCDDAYSTLIIAATQYTESDLCYISTVTIRHRKIIINDCIKHYKRYLEITRQKIKVHDNTLAYIVNAAIDAEIMAFKHDDKRLLSEMQKFDYKISKYKFDTKYQEIINQCFVSIDDQLQIAFGKMLERLKK